EHLQEVLLGIVAPSFIAGEVIDGVRRDHEVGLAVEVEVAHSKGLGVVPPDLDRLLRLEGAVTVPPEEEYGTALEALVGHHHIELAVTVEVAHREGDEGVLAGGEGPGGLEGAVPIPKEYVQFMVWVVQTGEIDLAVAVEVTNRDQGGLTAGCVGHRGVEA